MKILYNRLIPVGKRYYAINLFGVLFAKGPCNRTIITHEKIHTAQMKELGYLFFYLAYVVEWLIRVIQYRGLHKGYLNISFEKEAYCNQSDSGYPGRRRHYSFVSYY